MKDELTNIITMSIVFCGIMGVLLFSLLGWNGGYVEQVVYSYETTKQCYINEEWVEVDDFDINLIATDWYTIDGVKIFVQGKSLQCSKGTETTYVRTENIYFKGLKDIILFWTDPEEEIK